jgi:molybdate transport system regulatory protein
VVVAAKSRPPNPHSGDVCPGKIAVLEQIARVGSISGAGRALKISYKRTWDLVDELNQALGIAVVETARGGGNGGGAVLTEAGNGTVNGNSIFLSIAPLRCNRHVAYPAATMFSRRAVARISVAGNAAKAMTARNAVPPACPAVA